MNTVNKLIKSLSWGRFLLLWIAFLFVASFVGWVVLYGWLGAYESCRPESTMDQLMETTSAEEWTAYAKESIASSASEYDNLEELITTYSDTILQNASYSYMKDALNSTDETRYYTIRAGKAAICRVALTQEKKAVGLGMHAWTLSDISPIDIGTGIRPTHVEITAPSAEPVYVNGKLLSDNCITDSNIAYPDMSEAESRRGCPAHAVKYVIDRMYGSVVVSDATGTEILPERVSDGNAYYNLEPKVYSVTVVAPDSATVYLNGIALTAADCTGNKDALCVGLERYTDNCLSHISVYEFPNLYEEPTFTAVMADGITLQPRQDALGNIGFFPEIDEALLQTWEKAVDAYFKRYVAFCTSNFNKAKYNGVINHTLPQSSLCRYLKDAYWIMDWNSISKVTYTALDYGDYRQISDKCFSCTIHYAADLSSRTYQGVVESSISNTYELVFVKKGSRWLAAYMSAQGDT